MIQVEAITQAYLLNRYLAYVRTKFVKTGKEKTSYAVQWQNIWADIKGLFSNPNVYLPRVAYSLIAFFYIFQGRHFDSVMTSFFFMGTITFDAATPSDDVGEVPSITYTPTVGSGSDRYIIWDAQGFGGTLVSTFGGVSATVVVNKSGDQKVWGFLNPATGTGNNIVVATTGGNSILTSVAVSFSGVDQTTPTGATNYAESSNPLSVSLTTTTADAMRVDFGVCINDNASNASATFDGNAPATSWNGAQNQFRVFTAVAYTPQAVAGADSMSWSFTNAGFYQIGYAVEVIAATGGGGSSQIKKVSPTAQASVKKIAGVAIASVKKFIGVTNV